MRRTPVSLLIVAAGLLAGCDDDLTFRFDYGDGVLRTQTFCRNDHTYRSPGTFRATFCATDGIAGHESSAGFRVKVE